MQRDMLSMPGSHTQLQALQSIELSSPSLIHSPAFATQEHPNAQILKPRVRKGQFSNAHPQSGLILCSALSITGIATELGQPTGPYATDLNGTVKLGG
jgi:hypothetical protein